MTLAPVKAGAVMMRTRISCGLNISASPLYALSAMPYWRRAPADDPPLWSSAAMKPSFADIGHHLDIAMIVVLA